MSLAPTPITQPDPASRSALTHRLVYGITNFLQRLPALPGSADHYQTHPPVVWRGRCRLVGLSAVFSKRTSCGISLRPPAHAALPAPYPSLDSLHFSRRQSLRFAHPATCRVEAYWMGRSRLSGSARPPDLNRPSLFSALFHQSSAASLACQVRGEYNPVPSLCPIERWFAAGVVELPGCSRASNFQSSSGDGLVNRLCSGGRPLRRPRPREQKCSTFAPHC
jgi:hypothetical protein